MENKKYDKNNKGTLGRNKIQRPDKQDPEYSGEVMIDGTGYWISAWIKTNGETGEKFFSLAFKPKGEKKPEEKKPEEKKPEEKKPELKDDDLSNIPF